MCAISVEFSEFTVYSIYEVGGVEEYLEHLSERTSSTREGKVEHENAEAEAKSKSKTGKKNLIISHETIIIQMHFINC